MQTANFYLIEGVPGAWQFWAEGEDSEHCWLAPADPTATLAGLAQLRVNMQISGQFALVPIELLHPFSASEQPQLF